MCMDDSDFFNTCKQMSFLYLYTNHKNKEQQY